MAQIPEGHKADNNNNYDKRLTKDEFTDLMAFLTRQGRKPIPVARRGGGEDG